VNVRQLQEALQAALDRGLSPDTTVVIDQDGWYNILEAVDDPSTGNGPDMWFTLFHHQPADSRFTPGGVVHPVIGSAVEVEGQPRWTKCVVERFSGTAALVKHEIEDHGHVWADWVAIDRLEVVR
jgi:hypothetical protein